MASNWTIEENREIVSNYFHMLSLELDEIANRKHNLSIIQRDHPLAYIIDAKKKLEK